QAMRRAGESVFIFAIVSDHFPRLDAQLGDIEGSRSCRSEESRSIGLPLVHDWLVRDSQVASKGLRGYGVPSLWAGYDTIRLRRRCRRIRIVDDHMDSKPANLCRDLPPTGRPKFPLYPSRYRYLLV